MVKDDGESIEIVIADKSPLVKAGLTDLFGEDRRFSLVATAADGERFLEAVDRLIFDIGIIGWDMPYTHGQDVLLALRERKGGPRIIVYTGNQSPGIPRQVLLLGGAGFCSKSAPPQQLVDAVLAVARGQMVFPFIDMSQPISDPLAGLTPREQELLAALARGLTNEQIAHDLGISLNTVKFHLKNLYGKLEVRNRAQAVASYLTVHGTA